MALAPQPSQTIPGIWRQDLPLWASRAKQSRHSVSIHVANGKVKTNSRDWNGIACRNNLINLFECSDFHLWPVIQMAILWLSLLLNSGFECSISIGNIAVPECLGSKGPISIQRSIMIGQEISITSQTCEHLCEACKCLTGNLMQTIRQYCQEWWWNPFKMYTWGSSSWQKPWPSEGKMYVQMNVWQH